MKRREFIRNVAVAGAGALVFRSAPRIFAQTVAGRIEILMDEPLGTISPNIYGHFAENLSGVIYDGIWVGENSKVPNIGGIRKELVDEMKKINPAIVRFPGGCFADSYDWRDGVGPVDKRPRRTNFWNGGEKTGAPDAHRYDPNRFGTNEFVQFCQAIGAQPYLAANLRSLPAQEFNRWIEYCNSPAGSTTLADMRAAAGFKDPFNVHYWGVGNESWGCGGNFTRAGICRRVPQIHGVGAIVPVKETFPLSRPDPMTTSGTGRADFWKRLCARGRMKSGEFSAWHCTTTHGT